MVAISTPTKASRITLLKRKKEGMNSEERHKARYLRRKAKREEKKAVAMRRYDDFDKVFTFDNLWKSYHKCVRGVGWKASTQIYRNRPITNIARTLNALRNGTYKSKGFYAFTIVERGKTRNIKSVHISERVVQRCLCDYSLIPAFMPTLIYDNGACMKGKGIDFAKDRTDCHLHRYFRQNKTNDGYVLCLDFSSYFDRITHGKLREIITKQFTDERIIKLYMHFVDMFGEVGIGLGSQISQISAIRYPSELDHAIKERLRVRFYGRYMDDSYLVHKDKSYLWFCKSIIEEICGEYGIILNARKTQITKLSRGFMFLKQRYVLTDKGEVLRIPDKAGAKRARRKIKAFTRWLKTGKMALVDAISSVNAHLAHYKRSNARRTVKSIVRYFNKSIQQGDK